MPHVTLAEYVNSSANGARLQSRSDAATDQAFEEENRSRMTGTRFKDLFDVVLHRVPFFRYVRRILLEERHSELALFTANVLMALAVATLAFGPWVITLAAETAAGLRQSSSE